MISPQLDLPGMIKILSVAVIGIMLLSCSDDEMKAKGCTDPLAVNFDEAANSDDNSCVYPADMLAGIWQVSEEVKYTNISTSSVITYPPATYSATISAEGKTKVKILIDRPSAAAHEHNLPLTVNWNEQEILFTGSSIQGEIE